MFDDFLSHSAKGKQIVHEIAGWLQKDSLAVWPSLTSRFRSAVKRSFMALLILFSSLSETVCASEVETLVETLKKTAKPGSGITEEEQEIAKKLHATGPAAIPYLLPLLREKNKDVRELASYTLRDMEGLTEQHLDDLIDSCRRGDGWIPPAIARIGTPKAVAFLVEELVRQRETHTQVTWAIEMLGTNAVPALVQVYQNENGWDDKLEWAMNFVLKEMGKKALSAIDPLLKIATNATESADKRVRAITAVGSIGLPAEQAVPTLQELRQQKDTKIRGAALAAILNIGTAEAAPLLVEQLDQAKDPAERRGIIIDIANLKSRGNSTGSALVKYVADDDWEVRVCAVRALGDIGYKEAEGDLLKLLNRPDDWHLVFSAVAALENLKSERAPGELSSLSQNHWYPPVRVAARNAIKAIRDDSPREPKSTEESPPFGVIDREPNREGMESLDENEADLIRFPVATRPDQLFTVVIKTPIGGRGNQQGRGVQVEDGHLIGTDRGEWGGEITFIDLKGNSRVIVTENTEAIYKTTDGIFAVTGLAHMGINDGFLFRLTKDAHGSWTAKKWRALPGAPRFSRLLTDGSLFISCYDGIVLVFPNGEMKSLTRKEVLRSPSSPPGK